MTKYPTDINILSFLKDRENQVKAKKKKKHDVPRHSWRKWGIWTTFKRFVKDLDSLTKCPILFFGLSSFYAVLSRPVFLVCYMDV